MAYLKQSEVDGGKPKRSSNPEPQAKTAAPQAQRPKTGFPSDYGRFYWCIKTEVSEDGEIYVMADDVRFLPSGGVLFFSMEGETESARLALAPGQWTAVYSASCLDGHAVAVEHWKGEVARS